MYDRQEGLYKCWYSPFISDLPAKGIGLAERQQRSTTSERTGDGLCYAASDDGIVWDKPELGLVDFEGSTENNLGYPYGARLGCSEGGTRAESGETLQDSYLLRTEGTGCLVLAGRR